MSDRPRVSIGIPTYNMGQFVGRAVESALAQTWADLEVVVCDNASTDDTSTVLARFNDPRLRVIRHPSNIGMIANFNAVVSETRAPLIKFLEADDLLEPHCLEKMIEVMDSHPNVGLVSCGSLLIDPKDQVTGQRIKKQAEGIPAGSVLRSLVLTRGNVVGTPTDVLVRRRLLDKVGLFDGDYGAYLNDWDLWIRCSFKEDIFLMVEPLTRVRQHPGQVGATGSRSNVDIGVNFLFLEKRWNHPRVFSPLWWQKMHLRLSFSEGYVWRGIRRALSRSENGSGRDVFSKLRNSMGTAGFLAALTYSFFHAPLYLVDRLIRRRRRAVRA